MDGIVDSIEEYLERRADEPPSVTREFSFAADVVDDLESQNSQSSNDSQVVNAAQKFVELLSKSAQSKVYKSAFKFPHKVSDSEEKESEEDELLKGKLDSNDFDRLLKGIKKPALTAFSGDKDPYDDWKEQFEVFVDRKSPAKTKMMILKNSLSGKLDTISGKRLWRNMIRSMEVKRNFCNGTSKPFCVGLLSRRLT